MHTSWSTWNPLKPFGRERTEVVQILEEVLKGRLDCREWDGFLRIPMKGTPDLDAIRIACAALESEETVTDDGTTSHSELARQKIRALLESLKRET